MRRTKMTTRISAILASCAFIFAFVSPPASRADSKLRIMTATTDLAALAQEIGGEKVDVESVARGYQDPHFVEAKPSFLLQLRHADLLIVVGYVEPRPGIPPSPQHTVELIGQMKRDGVKLILVEPYFDLKTPNSIARETGAKVVVLMPSVGGEKEITDYFKLFDYDIAKLKQAFDTTK